MHRHAQSSTSCDCPKRKAQYVVFTFLTMDDGQLILVRRCRDRRQPCEGFPASRVEPVSVGAETSRSTRVTQSRASRLHSQGRERDLFSGSEPGTIGDEDEG